MKSKDSSHVTTFMQPSVIYCAAAFSNYRLSIPAHLVARNLPQKICLERRGRGSKREPHRKVRITGIYWGPAAYTVSFPVYVGWMQLCVWSYKCLRCRRMPWAGHEIPSQAHGTSFKFQSWPFLPLLCCWAVCRFCHVLLSCLETELSAANGIQSGFEWWFWIQILYV